jgi:hypothetical protein
MRDETSWLAASLVAAVCPAAEPQSSAFLGHVHLPCLAYQAAFRRR